LLSLNQRSLMELYKMKAGSLQCMMSYISLIETMYELLFVDLLITMLSAPNGSSKTS
jgi:hypothetical protein